MICTVLRIRKDGLGVLNPVLCYELRETEIRAPVDTSGDVRTVGADCRRKVLNREVGVGEQFVFAQCGGDFVKQFVGLLRRGPTGFLFFLWLHQRDGLFRHEGMRSHVAQAVQENGHEDRRDGDEYRAVKRIPPEEV